MNAMSPESSGERSSSSRPGPISQFEEACERPAGAGANKPVPWPKIERFLLATKGDERLILLLRLTVRACEIRKTCGALTEPVIEEAIRLYHQTVSEGTLGGPGIVCGPPGYELDGQPIGKGGIGIVFRAVQKKGNRIVALKLIRDGSKAEAETLARFRVEGQLIRDLHHANVVEVYEIGEHNGLPYYSMEYCSGGSLSDQLRDRPLAPRAAANLLVTIANALQAVHDLAVTHRDLKPANILFDSGGTPKIADFGLAKRWGEGDEGAIMGTPHYMAPEQFESDRGREVGPRSDVWALGAILYECLTRTRPFEGAEFDKIRAQVLNDDPEPLRQRVPSVPRDLETICMKCVEKAPADRYATAKQLGQDLQRFLDGKRPVARPPSLWRRGKRWAERNRTFATAVAGSVLLLLLAVGAAFLYQQIQLAEAERKARVTEEKARQAAELDADKRRALAETIVRSIPQPNPLGLNGYAFSVSPRYSDKLAFKDVIVRAEQIGREQGASSPRDEAVRATVLDNLGNAFQTLGYFDKAKHLLTEALELRRKLADDESLGDRDMAKKDFAESLFHLALLHHERGNFVAADPLYREALELRRKYWSEDDPRITEILYHRAWVCLEDEDFGKSIELFEEVLRLRRHRSGADDIDVLRTQLALDAIPAERGQTRESLVRFVPTITKLAEKSSDHDLIEAVNQLKLGLLLGEVGFTRRRGIEALEHAFEHIRRTEYLGPTHLYAAFIAARIAELCDQAGRIEDAEKWYGMALGIIANIDAFVQGKTRDDVANYARFLNRHGRRDEGDKLFVRLLAAQRAHFGSGEPTLTAVAGLIGNLASPPAGTVWSAAPLAYRDASPDHFVIAAVLREYAKVLGEWGEVHRQQEALQQALQILEQTGGVRRQHYAPCLLDLAETRLRQGDIAGTMALLDRARDAEQQWLERREQLQAQILAVRARTVAIALAGSSGWPW